MAAHASEIGSVVIHRILALFEISTMHGAEIGEDLTDCSAVSDHNASWPGPHNSRSTTNDDVTVQDAQAANPSHGTAPTRQGFQGNLPSGLGTLTAATCQITLLEPDPGKKRRSANGRSLKAEPSQALKGTAAARIHTQEKAVTNVGGAADHMSLSRRTMQHVRPKSAPGMTIVQPSDRTRCRIAPLVGIVSGLHMDLRLLAHLLGYCLGGFVPPWVEISECCYMLRSHRCGCGQFAYVPFGL